VSDRRPLGFLQVDVDGLWAVRACYGKPERDSFVHDPCWSEGVARLDRVFAKVGSPAAFFIVGRDLEVATKADRTRQLLSSGYELANHSYTHRIGLTLRPYGEILDELKQTDTALRRLGADPVGFRAPGYDLDARVLRAVRQLGYWYDASMLPTYLGPLLRLADAWLSRGWNPSKRQFGRFAYGRAPRAPYFPLDYKVRKPSSDSARSTVLELPVGTTPTLHLPLTAASLFPMDRGGLRRLFERLASKRRPCLLLLHAIDGVDCTRPIVFDNRRPALGGFNLSGEAKERRLRRIVEEFSRVFRVVPARDFARIARHQGTARPSLEALR